MRLPDHRSLLGKPYGNLARGPEAYSCMGLVLAYYEMAGIYVTDPGGNRGADAEIAEREWDEVSLFEILPGDVLVFSKEGKEIGGHVGIYLGNKTVLHSRQDRGVVVEMLPIPGMVEQFGYRRNLWRGLSTY